MNIKIDEEFKNLIPPLTEERYQGLQESIVKDGVRNPIDLWEGVIVDGHNRYEICQKHNLECPTRTIDFESRIDAKIWIYDNQRNRRNSTPEQLLTFGMKKIALVKIKAKEKQRGGQGGVLLSTISEKANEPLETIDATKELADFAGVGYGTASKFKRVYESDNEEVKEKVQSGEMSINKGYQEIRKPVYINLDEEEEVIIEETKSFEKDKLKQIDNMIIDELFKTIERRLARTKSNREVKRVLLSLIKKLSIWVEQL